MQKVFKSINTQIIILSLFIIVSFFHLLHLSDIPKGFYVDELSIAYNALLVEDTGYDEHGKFFPIYFEAFGEYKNPIYIYATAFIFKFFGVSEFNLRLTSFIFYILFLFGIYLFTKGLFKDNKIVSIYTILGAGFLPWFFTLSRVSFEVISQLTIVTFSILFVFKTYYSTGKYNWLNALLAGLLIGLSVYSYSTSRLLSFFFMLSLSIIYFRKNIKRTTILIAAFIITLIPYITFLIYNPGALTRRFIGTTYLFDPSITKFEKVYFFLKNYVSYFRLDFLILNGDENLRHATGYGGELLIVVFLLFLIGLTLAIIKKEFLKDKFCLFLFLNLLFSPVAASLTIDPPYSYPHSLRGILLGLYILIFSCYGLSSIFFIKDMKKRNGLLVIVYIMLTFQSILYVYDYFVRYPSKSIAWFESYDFKNTLITAIEQKPNEIIISNIGYGDYPHLLLEFYKNIVNNASIRLAPPILNNNTCIIYFSRDEMLSHRTNNLSDEFSIAKLLCS